MNIESSQDNCKKMCVCMFFYQSSNSISDFYLSLPFPKKAKLCVLKIFWLVAQKGKDNREISHRDDHMVITAA